MSDSIEQMGTKELEDTLAAIQLELKTRQKFHAQKERLIRLKEMTEAQAFRLLWEIDQAFAIDDDEDDYQAKLAIDCVLYTYNSLQMIGNIDDYLRPLPTPVLKSKPIKAKSE